MQHTEDAWLHHQQFQLVRTAEHSAKTPLDAEAHVNTSFCNMLHYHGIKSNRKTQLGRDLATFCSAGLTSELDQIVHGLVLLKSENVRRWKKIGLSQQHVPVLSHTHVLKGISNECSFFLNSSYINVYIYKYRYLHIIMKDNQVTMS